MDGPFIQPKRPLVGLMGRMRSDTSRRTYVRSVRSARSALRAQDEERGGDQEAGVHAGQERAGHESAVKRDGERAAGLPAGVG
jgi:hypothetical protein